MRVLVNNTEVQISYLAFEEEKTGAILQLLLSASNERAVLHRKLADDLKEWYPIGVMDQEEIVEDCTEIRLLSATVLQAIDLLRLLGYAVQEIHPHF